MRVIAIANQKGGCGKTTTSINFTACLAYLQKKILLVDLDPQGHSTCGLGIRAEKLPYSLYDLLNPTADFAPGINQVIIELNPYLSLLPSHIVLGAAEEELANLPDKEKRLKQVLENGRRKGHRFDYVVIDCAPNLGILTFNALEVADEVIIPIEPSFFSLHGLAKISETLRFINQKRDSRMEIHALLTIFDARTHFEKDIYEEVKKNFGEKLFKTIIHDDVALKEAAGAGQSIVQYAPDSQAFKDYFSLAVEYLEREWERKLPEDELGWENIYRHRYGPRRVIGGVLFQMLSEKARTVEIAGDFNGWVPETMSRQGEGKLWRIVLPLENGKYRYKFIVDGEWQLDPCQQTQVENSFGYYDSFLELV